MICIVESLIEEYNKIANPEEDAMVLWYTANNKMSGAIEGSGSNLADLLIGAMENTEGIREIFGEAIRVYDELLVADAL